MKASNNGNGKKDHNIEQAVRERYAQGAKVRGSFVLSHKL